jgi:hypothetical protein
MPSFNLVNYSLRANKSIQRSLVFDGVRRLQAQSNLDRMIYVGLGSIWFSDFQLAHKFLGIEDMVSIEANEIGFRRAKFNQPYKTVRVESGLSSDVLPVLFADEDLTLRPWFIWLDYDQNLSETTVTDLRTIIENAPPDSIVITTFSASGGPLGKPANRPDRIKSLLGAVVPDDLSKEACRDERLSETLLDLTRDFMASVAASSSRPGGFVEAFRIAYRDSTPMVTVGGILPSKGAAPYAKSAVADPKWPGIADSPIIVPPLTPKEVALLQGQFPSTTPLTRATVQQFGFDLEEEQLRSFEKYYRYYPIYAQINS